MSKKYILVIETVAAKGSISLFSDDSGQIKELGFVVGTEGIKLSKDLIGLIAELLKRFELNLSELSTVVVANGPGSFTGLRVGFSVARGLAKGLRIPFRTFSTLDALFSETPSDKLKCSFISIGGGKLAYKLSNGEATETKSLSEFQSEVLTLNCEFTTIRETYNLIFREGSGVDLPLITVASDNLSSLAGTLISTAKFESKSINYT
jgi:tRNA threonylcarbamoyl adenosine modification protein YeaZ